MKQQRNEVRQTSMWSIRRFGAAVIAIPVAMLLSGCLSVASTVVVNSDATASGEFSLEVARQPAALLGIASAETLNGALRDSGQADFASPSECVASEDEAFLRLTCPFVNESFTDPTDWLLIRREGQTITISVRQEGQEQDLMDIPLGTLSVELQTPGPIRSVSGQYATQTGDNTARVVASLSVPVDVVITADATGSALPSWLPLAAGIGAVLALVAVVVLLLVLLRRRKGTPEAAPPPSTPSPLPPQTPPADTPADTPPGDQAGSQTP